MFILPEELKTAIYAYQLSQITEADSTITLAAIAAAEAELSSYLLPNSRKEWQDGRPVYNVAAILAATGNNRNPLLLEICKNITIWHLTRLCHVDMVYEQVKERYDRAIKWLEKLAAGELTLQLPVINPNADDEANAPVPFRSGSRTKFNHDI